MWHWRPVMEPTLCVAVTFDCNTIVPIIAPKTKDPQSHGRIDAALDHPWLDVVAIHLPCLLVPAWLLNGCPKLLPCRRSTLASTALAMYISSSPRFNTTQASSLLTLSSTTTLDDTASRQIRIMGNMFDTNFSFLSGSSEPTSATYHTTSTDISPFTSRCSSPQTNPSFRTQRDTRFDSYRASRPSITDLTAQLQSHALAERSASVVSETPSLRFDGEDEGYYEGPDTPSTSASDLSSDFDPTLWDLSMSESGVTSSPRPSLSLEAQAISSYTMRRRQRQVLVRLQCLAKRTPDLAMLIEECHPSSLPLSTDLIWGATSRSGSLSGPSSGRIEKDRATASVRKMPRMRKRSGRS